MASISSLLFIGSELTNTCAAASRALSLPATRAVVVGCSGLRSDYAGAVASASAFPFPFLAPAFATVAFCSGEAAGWSTTAGVASAGAGLALVAFLALVLVAFVATCASSTTSILRGWRAGFFFMVIPFSLCVQPGSPAAISHHEP